MRLDEGCTINNVARLDKQEEIDAESAEVEVKDAVIAAKNVVAAADAEENNDNNNE